MGELGAVGTEEEPCGLRAFTPGSGAPRNPWNYVSVSSESVALNQSREDLRDGVRLPRFTDGETEPRKSQVSKSSSSCPCILRPQGPKSRPRPVCTPPSSPPGQRRALLPSPLRQEPRPGADALLTPPPRLVTSSLSLRSVTGPEALTAPPGSPTSRRRENGSLVRGRGAAAAPQRAGPTGTGWAEG